MADSVSAAPANVFGLILLRDRLLPDLLQDDQQEILYWAGKSLARDVTLNGINALEQFFAAAGFGVLQMTSQKAVEQTWKLTGPVVDERLAENKDASFDLEAGFLAQATEMQLGFGAEAQYKVGKNQITFTVLTEDSADLLD
jgi:hypothetical protein